MFNIADFIVLMMIVDERAHAMAGQSLQHDVPIIAA